MRCLFFFLAVLIPLLSCLPCADATCISIPATTKEHKEKGHPQQQDDQQHPCSPFCYCSCCQVVVANPNLQTIVITAPAYKLTHSFSYVSALIRGTSFDFWQPPRIS